MATACRRILGLVVLCPPDNGSFYEQLARPDWAPPASLFAPVWTILYLLIGVAAVWRFNPAVLAAATLGPG